jgi:hypothetical protein
VGEAVRTVVLGDVSERVLSRVASSLELDGFKVVTQPVDVAARASLRALAETAAKLGSVEQVAHTAGLSPVQASTQAILQVDLYGVALMLDEFAAVVAPGGAGVVIASMAGHLARNVPADFEQTILRTATDDLLRIPFFDACT